MSVVPAREGPRDRARSSTNIKSGGRETEGPRGGERREGRTGEAPRELRVAKGEIVEGGARRGRGEGRRSYYSKKGVGQAPRERVQKIGGARAAAEGFGEREASSPRTPASPSKPARDVLDPETVAVDAVLAALSDVLVAECATEVEFELEFGLSEAQLLGLAPLPEAPARNPSLEEQIVAGRQNLRARSASPPARRDAAETPATLLRGWAREQAPSSGSSKASPTLRDLETTFRSLSSDLSPSTAQGVLDGLESPLDGLVR